MSGVDEVRERSDIVDVVGGYVQLKKAGRSYKALCPFHQEKTPSFVVNPERGTWHCFGACGIGGDVFSFVMRAENLDFRGALELLARRAGVALDPPSPEVDARQRERERLHEVLAAAAAFYHRQLMRAAAAEAARAYLKERAFDAATARRFELGWAPPGGEELAAHLRAEGFQPEDMMTAGLLREAEDGRPYLTFRARLTFPIRDARGRAIGFGARTLEPGGQPKYLNSPQTAVFDKSRVLYALDLAGPSIRAAGEAVVVEGYTDVIRAHVSGFANVVAALGTALTAAQVQALKRRAKRIVLALDADSAGQAATLRGLSLAQEALAGEAVRPVLSAGGLVRYVHELDVDLRVATLPPGQDPDEVLRADPAAWGNLVRQAQPVMAFLIEAVASEVDLDSPRGKSEAIDRLLPFLIEIPDPVLRAAWVAEVAARVRVDERSIENRLAAPRAPRRARRAVAVAPESSTQSEPAAQPAVPSRPPRADLAGFVLGHLLAAPRRLRDVNRRLAAAGQPPLGAKDFEGVIERDLLAAVRHAMLGVPPPDAPPEQRLDELPPSHAELAAALAAQAQAEPPVTEAARVRALGTAVLRLREQACYRALSELRHLAAGAPPEEQSLHAGRSTALSAELLELHRLLAGGERH